MKTGYSVLAVLVCGELIDPLLHPEKKFSPVFSVSILFVNGF